MSKKMTSFPSALMLTTQDLAAALGVSTATINRAARTRVVESTPIGRSRRFDRSVVDRLRRNGIPSRGEMERATASPRPHWCDIHGDVGRCRCIGKGGPR